MICSSAIYGLSGYKDGTKFPVLVYTASIIRNGIPVGIRGIVLDITARKETEEKLRQLRKQAKHYQNLVNGMILL